MVAKNTHREDIKAAIRKRGSSLTKLASANGLDSSTLYQCLIRPMPTGNRIVAKFMGQSLHDLWPEWFDEDGRRTYLSRTYNSRSRRLSHGERDAA